MARGTFLLHLFVTIFTIKHGTHGRTEFPSLTSVAAKFAFKQRPPIATTSDYLSLVQNSNIFIDKSLLIDALLADPNEKVIALLAPEKWGKSVNLRMIEYFTQIPTDSQGNLADSKDSFFYRLLYHSEIILPDGEKETLSTPLLLANYSNSVVDKYMGKYPTIYLDLSTLLNSTNYNDVMVNLATAIGNIFRKYSYVKVGMQNQFQNRSLTRFEQIELNSTIEEFANYEEHKAEAADLTKSLAFLTKVLRGHFKSRVIILFDDYDILLDILLNKNISQPDKRSINHILSLLFRHTFEINNFLEKGILTGRHDISKLIKLEKLITVYSTTLDETYEFYGFSMSKVIEMLNILQISDADRDKYYTWGDWSIFIRISGSVKYNCQSFVNFINSRNLDYIPRRTDIVLEDVIQNNLVRKSLMDTVLKYNNNSVPLHHLSIDKAEMDCLSQIYSNNATDFNSTLPILQAYLWSAEVLTPIARNDTRPTITNVRISNELIRMKMAKIIVSYYIRRYHIPEDLLPQLTNQLRQFIETNANYSQDVESTIQKIVDHLPLFDEKYKTEAVEAPIDVSETDQILRVILHMVFLNLSFQNDYDIVTTYGDRYSYIMLYKSSRAIMIDLRIDMPIQEIISIMLKRVFDTYKYTYKDIFTVIGFTLGNDKKINVMAKKAQQQEIKLQQNNNTMENAEILNSG